MSDQQQISNREFYYKATVKSENDTKFYVFSTGITFEGLYTKHKYSFKHEKRGNATTLLQYIRKIKNNITNVKIYWEIFIKTTKTNTV